MGYVTLTLAIGLISSEAAVAGALDDVASVVSEYQQKLIELNTDRQNRVQKYQDELADNTQQRISSRGRTTFDPSDGNRDARMNFDKELKADDSDVARRLQTLNETYGNRIKAIFQHSTPVEQGLILTTKFGQPEPQWLATQRVSYQHPNVPNHPVAVGVDGYPPNRYIEPVPPSVHRDTNEDWNVFVHIGFAMKPGAPSSDAIQRQVSICENSLAATIKQWMIYETVPPVDAHVELLSTGGKVTTTTLSAPGFHSIPVKNHAAIPPINDSLAQIAAKSVKESAQRLPNDTNVKSYDLHFFVLTKTRAQTFSALKSDPIWAKLFK